MVNLTDDEHQRLCELAQRAEAAEARAADAEIRAKSWHDSAMTLADQRDAAYKRNAELEAQLTGAATVVVTLTTERDTFAAENDAIHRAVNEMCGTDTSTIEAVQHAIEQRDELSRKLEQAQQACSYWLTDGRFLVANSPEYQKAIDMLAINTP